jgi:pilus biogenesis lipoprotein CpaD
MASPRHLIRSSALLLALAVSACGGGEPYQSDPQALEPRDVYPLQVESEIASLDIIGDGRGNLLPTESLRLDRLVDDFAVNGNGPLVVQTPPAHGPGGDRLYEAVAARALGRGLALPEVEVREVADQTGAISVSFERVYVRLPECRGWWVESTFNPSNSPHINFGCATQRALGMMVANPADLIGPSSEGQSLDAIRSGTIIQLYRVGEVFISDEPKKLEAEASQVSK